MDLIKIHSANDQIEADLLRAYLNDNGIESHIQGYNHRSLYGVVGAFIRLDLLVPAIHEEKARELVSEFLKGSIQDENFSEVESHENLNDKPLNPKIAFILSFCWPGLGNLYAGSQGLGILFLLVSAFSSVYMMSKQNFWVMILIVMVFSLDCLTSQIKIRSHNEALKRFR